MRPGRFLRHVIDQQMRDSRAGRVYGLVMFPMMEADDIHDELLGILNAILESTLPPDVGQSRLEGLPNDSRLQRKNA